MKDICSNLPREIGTISIINETNFLSFIKSLFKVLISRRFDRQGQIKTI